MCDQLTPVDKPAFVPSPEYLARQKRFDDSLNLRKPDWAPFAPLVVHYYPTKIKGISNRDAHYDMGNTIQAWKKATIRYGWDAAVPWGSLLTASGWDSLGITQVKWRGGALGPNQPFQWVEGEYLKQDEYDELLSDPNRFAVTKLWPRISTVLAPIRVV